VLWIELQDVPPEHVKPADANLDKLITANTGGPFHTVEVAPGDLAWIGHTSGTTSNAVTERVHEFVSTALAKTPVTAPDKAGFIVTRS
jgi:3-hydroxyacyl-CoA dehydrogenase